MAVVSSAQIQLEAIDALVVLVIDWQVIGKHAPVSYNFIVINFSRKNEGIINTFMPFQSRY